MELRQLISASATNSTSDHHNAEASILLSSIHIAIFLTTVMRNNPGAIINIKITTIATAKKNEIHRLDSLPFNLIVLPVSEFFMANQVKFPL